MTSVALRYVSLLLLRRVALVLLGFVAVAAGFVTRSPALMSAPSG